MKVLVENYIEKLNNDVKNLNVSPSTLEHVKNIIKRTTYEYVNTFDENKKIKLRNELVTLYNVLYYLQFKINGLDRFCNLDYDILKLPSSYIVDEKPIRFDINYELLNSINISEGLSIDCAYELLKWTVNNTRDNFSDDDVYGNASLMGACGFSQFSTLYPLQKLGLHVTINNTSSFNGARHAFGTVVIPIRDNDVVTNKRFLLDCTYRQFFTIPDNVFSRYLGDIYDKDSQLICSPSVGFFVYENEELIEFSKELLRNGFVLATEDNLEKYLKPFMAELLPFKDISSIDQKFSEIDLLSTLENKVESFDYDEDEFINWGCNLNIPKMKSI